MIMKTFSKWHKLISIGIDWQNWGIPLSVISYPGFGTDIHFLCFFLVIETIYDTGAEE